MYMDTSLYNVLVSCSYTSTNIQASPTIRVFDLFESTLNVLVRLNGSSYMIDIFFSMFKSVKHLHQPTHTQLAYLLLT